MDNKLTNIKERILFFAKNQGITYESFFKEIGMSYGSFKGDNKKRPINSDALENILTIYSNINPGWLLTGKGPMLRANDYLNTPSEPKLVNEETYNNYKGPIISPNKKEGIPLLPLDAFAGNGDEMVNGVNFDTIEERYEVPLFRGLKVDFMIPVRGSSMYPKYNSGDVVACRIIKELLFIQWNKVYVIDTISQGVIMKRLKKSEYEDRVICKSDNKDYDEFELPKSDIRNIALVVGVVRLE